MNELGKFLFLAGLIMAGVGLLLWIGAGKGWFGRMPGDISYSGEKFKFHFPIATCLVISIVLSLVVWLVNSFRK